MDSYPIRFRDPVHGFIHLSARELRLVESRPFQRLRNIKQLALTYLVYPGAMHTRFEHSLGVMELAHRAFQALESNPESKGRLQRTLRKIDMTVSQAQTLLRVTALLHDVGHLPFSHGGEDLLRRAGRGKVTKHEQVSIAVIRGTELSKLLERNFYPGIVKHIALLLGEGEPPPELLILKKLISGQFDADRMDYLSRDSLHCGVGYGNFDYLRLLETLRVRPSKEGGLELCVERGGLHTLEAMILARYWMFTQVYFQKTRRIYDIYLSKYLNEWYDNQYADILRILNFDDLTLMNDIIRDGRARTRNTRAKYARRILTRQHHHVVYETSDHADASDVRLAMAVEKNFRDKFPKVDTILDRQANGKVHTFFVRGDEEYGDDFQIHDTVSDHYARLSEESSILENVPRKFNVIRIYADVPKDHLSDYRKAADNIKQEEGGI